MTRTNDDSEGDTRFVNWITMKSSYVTYMLHSRQLSQNGEVLFTVIHLGEVKDIRDAKTRGLKG